MKGEIKVTVIATSFPADMPRKSLFAGTSTGQTLLKEENAAMAKKEIHNTIQSSNINSSDFFKKTEKKTEIIEDIIEDDTDEWSAVPAFLRRKK